VIGELNVILANVSRVVEARGMKFCAITAKDVFEAKTYAYARHENSLYITACPAGLCSVNGDIVFLWERVNFDQL
jgi:hypothetical protein